MAVGRVRVRALRPCRAAFVQKRTFLGSTDARAQERGEDGSGGDAQRRMGRARALGGHAGGTAACAARRVRAWRGRAARREEEREKRRKGAAGDGAQRPFDAAPPGLNRGAGLVPGTQVAGRRGRRGRRHAGGRAATTAAGCKPATGHAERPQLLGPARKSREGNVDKV